MVIRPGLWGAFDWLVGPITTSSQNGVFKICKVSVYLSGIPSELPSWNPCRRIQSKAWPGCLCLSSESSFHVKKNGASWSALCYLLANQQRNTNNVLESFPQYSSEKHCPTNAILDATKLDLLFACATCMSYILLSVHSFHCLYRLSINPSITKVHVSLSLSVWLSHSLPVCRSIHQLIQVCLFIPLPVLYIPWEFCQ